MQFVTYEALFSFIAMLFTVIGTFVGIITLIITVIVSIGKGKINKRKK